MRYVTTFLLVLTVGLCSSASGDEPPPEVLKVSDAYDAALLASDVKVLDTIWADDCILIDPDGTVQDKATALADVRRTKVESNKSTNRQFKVVGDNVLEVGEYEAKGTFKGEPFAWHFRYSCLWKRAGGQWVVVFDQVTSIAKK